KIAFANEIGRLGEELDVDATRVMELLCRDRKLNLSPKYLRPGFAYGGSCLPKDLRALNQLADQRAVVVPLLAALVESNDEHLRTAVRRILATGARRIGIAGLTFKSGTDDFRESPALRLARQLCDEGLDVRLFDPHLDASRLLGSNRRYVDALLPDWQRRLVGSAHELARESELVVATQADAAVARALSDSGHPVLALHGEARQGGDTTAEPVGS
ncbi:MAG: UDP binding domain-containing protein, partial [Thermoanaerobaculia bacterium]